MNSVLAILIVGLGTTAVGQLGNSNRYSPESALEGRRLELPSAHTTSEFQGQRSMNLDSPAGESIPFFSNQTGTVPDYMLPTMVQDPSYPSGTQVVFTEKEIVEFGGVYDPDSFEWQLLPKDIMYRSYLASPKESRLAAQIVSETDHDALFDGWLGGRFGLVRYGTRDPIYPLGVQVDIEGAGLLRLDIMNDVDVQSVDFRAGVPVSISWGRHQTRFGYYHLSSHTGDEYLLKNPGHQRFNFARDVLFIGHAYYLTPELRVYGDIGWAFYVDVAKEWELQFGVDYSPRLPTGWRGAPFWAVHGHLREEVNWGGGLTVQAGWAWRSDSSTGLLRTGLQYFNGMSPQYSFYNRHEQQIGFGLWYDY